MNPEDRKELLSKFLKQHRIQKGALERREIRQSEVIRRLKISSSTYSRWEQGESLPSPDLYGALFDYFGNDTVDGVSLSAILGIPAIPDDMPALALSDPYFADLVKVWPDLSNEDRRKLAAEARARREGGRDDDRQSKFQFAT